ncbi:Rha family transcriptional regulator [Nitrobacter hamburgensis]|nr:phage antirepressor KilAC domain-containing protein [Nitrobacter hamburgensis]
MSSREIAELVESRHDSVKRTVERLVERGVIGLPPTVEYPDTLGRKATEYRIGKRDSYIVVAQLSPEFTARLVDRWQELESTSGRALPQSFADALQLAADQARQIEQQHTLLIEQQPKVEFYDQFVKADGLLGYQEAGTAAGCYPNKFCNWLKIDHLFYRGKKLMPRSQFVRRGLFEIRPELDANGESHLRGWVTAKGVEHFAKHAPDWIRITPREVKP